MLHLSVGQWIFYGLLSIVWAYLGYRLSENDRKMLGRTPWGLPSMLWAFLWFLSLIFGLVLYLIAHSVGVRQAQTESAGAGPPPGIGTCRHPWLRGPPAGRAPTASELFPAYPRPANSMPLRRPPSLSMRASEPATAPRPTSRDLPMPRRTGRITSGLASRSERAVPLPLVGRVPVDVTGLDRRAPSDRHQSGPADRAILTVRPDRRDRQVWRAFGHARRQGGAGSDRPSPPRAM